MLAGLPPVCVVRGKGRAADRSTCFILDLGTGTYPCFSKSLCSFHIGFQNRDHGVRPCLWNCSSGGVRRDRDRCVSAERSSAAAIKESDAWPGTYASDGQMHTMCVDGGMHVSEKVG